MISSEQLEAAMRQHMQALGPQYAEGMRQHMQAVQAHMQQLQQMGVISPAGGAISQSASVPASAPITYGQDPADVGDRIRSLTSNLEIYGQWVQYWERANTRAQQLIQAYDRLCRENLDISSVRREWAAKEEEIAKYAQELKIFQSRFASAGRGCTYFGLETIPAKISEARTNYAACEAELQRLRSQRDTRAAPKPVIPESAPAPSLAEVRKVVEFKRDGTSTTTVLPDKMGREVDFTKPTPQPVVPDSVSAVDSSSDAAMPLGELQAAAAGRSVMQDFMSASKDLLTEGPAEFNDAELAMLAMREARLEVQRNLADRTDEMTSTLSTLEDKAMQRFYGVLTGVLSPARQILGNIRDILGATKQTRAEIDALGEEVSTFARK